MSLDEKRLILRDKVEASKQRLADNLGDSGITADAKEAIGGAADTAKDMIEKHPFAVLAGAVAVGLFIGSSGKKSAVKAAKKPVKQPSVIAKLLKDAAIAYGLKMMDNARKDGEALRSSVKDRT
ncbi:MAG: hypothetical protein ABJ242_10185 [Marinomonas sp.]